MSRKDYDNIRPLLSKDKGIVIRVVESGDVVISKGLQIKLIKIDTIADYMAIS